MKQQPDFGGISYTTGDFVTPGTSGFGAMDILSSFLTPELKDAAITSAKSTGSEIAKFVWAEYKVPIVLGTLFVVSTMLFENYSNVVLLKRTKK